MTQEFVGVDPHKMVELEAVFRSGAEGLSSVQFATARAIDSLFAIWRGDMTEAFAQLWHARHAVTIANAQATLIDAADKVNRNLLVQLETSNTLERGDVDGAVGGTSAPGGRAPDSDRLGSEEARTAVLDKAAQYFENPAVSERYPEASAKAEAWLEELDANSSPGQIAAFEKYMALLKGAFLQEMVVRNAGEFAMSQFVEAAEAGASAIGGAASVGGSAGPEILDPSTGEPNEIATHVLGEIYGGATDFAGGSLVDLISGHESLSAAAGELAVLRHRSEVDALLAGSIDQIELYTSVGHNDPMDIIHAQRSEYEGLYNEAVVHGEHSEAFTYFTGDGGAVDGVLRTSLKAVGGEALSKTLAGLEIAGNTASAGYHITAGKRALLLSGIGVNGLLEGFASLDGVT